MFVPIVATIVTGAIVVATAENLRRRKVIGNEVARKIVHISHALLLCSWVFFATYELIIWVELAAFAVVALAKVTKFLEPLRRVRRVSLGEFFFPVAIVILALMNPDKWLFVAAILHFGLADGLAAVVGKRVKSRKYKIFNNTKSVAGTLTFIAASIVVTVWIMAFSPLEYSVSAYTIGVLLIPLVVALVENFSPYGSDNFTVPIAAYILLNSFL